jgi:PST family polysaccharide transporter
MEKMLFIPLINLSMQLCVVIAIFTTVRQTADYLLYAEIISFGSISAGLVGAGVAFLVFKLRPSVPSWLEVWNALVEGWMLFLSMASVGLYTAGNPFILGLFADHTVVGYYSAAEKIVKGALGLVGPISQAAYPRFSKMASESKTQALKWGRAMLLVMSSLGLALSMALFVWAPTIVAVLLGATYRPSTEVIRTLAPIVFLISTATVWSTLMLIPFGHDRAVTTILVIAGAINLIAAFLLIPQHQEIGMAVAVLLSEGFVTIASLVYSLHRGLNPLGGLIRGFDHG